MKYSNILNEKISLLGFGMMRLPMLENGKIDFKKGEEMVDYALSHGITYFDTAYRYHDGESELFVKETLVKRHPRNHFLLTTKLPTWLINSKSEVHKMLSEQLKRVGTDYLDFYLLHSIDEESWGNIENNHMVEALVEEKSKGRIRHIGASFHCEPKLLRYILGKYGNEIEIIQLQINYFDWDYINAKELYEIALEFNKPVIVMEPLRGGMLSKLPSKNAQKILRENKNSTGLSYTDYAFGWVESLKNVKIILSGMSDLNQMRENICFFSRPDGLSQEQLDLIAQAKSELDKELFIPCTKCNYCQECPKGIKIPEIFDAYNDAQAKDFHFIWGSLSNNFKKIQPGAKDCIECGRCERACPQNIKIIQLLKDVNDKFEYLEQIGE